MARTSTTLVPQRRLRFKAGSNGRLTHYLFRYPAKFHPPIVSALLRKYSKRGSIVLDPFCGSGTLLVEAKVRGRNAIGFDIDPVAVFIAQVKTRPLRRAALARSVQALEERIERIRRRETDYERLKFSDISDRSYKAAVKRHRLKVPPIPNIFHWFRRYVVIDLGRLRKAITTLDAPRSHKIFLMACFCSIIRNTSNADPVPVSGLEVTAHMKAKDAKGRIIDPFANYLSALKRSVEDLNEFELAARSSNAVVRVSQGDATVLRKYLRTKVDVVITSPPYHNAVDYYRRHTLEMYWLGLVSDQEQRLALLPKYIGRAQVPQRHPFVKASKLDSNFARRWEATIRSQNPERANAFKHYTIAMQKCFSGLAQLLEPGRKAIFVLGKSAWNGRRLPTIRLFQEVAAADFRLVKHYWYPLKNRYMTYSRHNGANIDREHVLVFQRLAPPSIQKPRSTKSRK